MQGKTHKIGGACTGIVASSLLLHTHSITSDKLLIAGTIVVGSIIGSLIPDIDHTQSTLGRRIRPLSDVINKTFGHRGLTHAPLFHVLLTLLSYMFIGSFSGYSQVIIIGLIEGLLLGVISHLVLDALTTSGIPLMYPISKKRYRLAKIKTGSNTELTVSIILIVLTLIILAFL